MAAKRFIVEIGSGIDIHGEDATKAACRAVKDAISRSCLCGIVEIMGIHDLNSVDVEIVVAVPRPQDVARSIEEHHDRGFQEERIPVFPKIIVVKERGSFRHINGRDVHDHFHAPGWQVDGKPQGDKSHLHA